MNIAYYTWRRTLITIHYFANKFYYEKKNKKNMLWTQIN